MNVELIRKLYLELEEKLEKIDNGIEAWAEGLASAMSEISAKLAELKRHIIAEGFISDEEEIDFFKNIKPKFYALVIFRNESYNIKKSFPAATLKEQREYYQQELDFISRHFEQNAYLYQYFKMSESAQDTVYFLRRHNTLFDLCFGIADKEYATQQDYAFAKFIAYERLRDDLLRRVHQIDMEIRIPLIKAASVKSLQWTEAKIDLVELAYALYIGGCINDGKAELMDIIGWLEQGLQISLDDYHRKFIDISRRKLTGYGKFLGILSNGLEEFINNKSKYSQEKKKAVSRW